MIRRFLRYTTATSKHRVATAAFLAVVVYFGGLGGAYSLAIHNAATLTELCQAGNEFRAQQIGTWNYVIQLSGPPKTQQGRAVLAKFEHHLRVQLAPRDCSNLKAPIRP